MIRASVLRTTSHAGFAIAVFSAVGVCFRTEIRAGYFGVGKWRMVVFSRWGESCMCYRYYGMRDSLPRVYQTMAHGQLQCEAIDRSSPHRPVKRLYFIFIPDGRGQRDYATYSVTTFLKNL